MKRSISDVLKENPAENGVAYFTRGGWDSPNGQKNLQQRLGLPPCLLLRIARFNSVLNQVLVRTVSNHPDLQIPEEKPISMEDYEQSPDGKCTDWRVASPRGIACFEQKTYSPKL